MSSLCVLLYLVKLNTQTADVAIQNHWMVPKNSVTNIYTTSSSSLSRKSGNFESLPFLE